MRLQGGTLGMAGYPLIFRRELSKQNRPALLVGEMAAHIVLPWIHRLFALVKRWALGVYHGFRRKHVQAYLDEYCFRFNRRHWRKVSFDKMLGLAAGHGPTHDHQITGTPARSTKSELAVRLAKGKAVPPKSKPKRRAFLHQPTRHDTSA
ncbi:hypothetical protein CCP1ISM_9770001 [Azospirillaceae bacterium]